MVLPKKIKVEFVDFWKDWGILYKQGGCTCLMAKQFFFKKYETNIPENKKDPKIESS